MQTLLLNTVHWVFAQKPWINDNNTFLLLYLYYFVFEASNQCIFPDMKSPEISIMPDSAPAINIMANKNYAQLRLFVSLEMKQLLLHDQMEFIHEIILYELKYVREKHISKQWMLLKNPEN